MLRDADARVFSATNVSDALELLSTTTPDLLISDIAMPGQDGFALIESVRSSNGGTKDIPAIAFTAFASASDRKRALAAGYRAHLTKPIQPDELLAACVALLEM